MTGDAYDVAVIGVGVIGATIALHLARGGMRVAAIDAGPICRQASGVNAGTLTMQMTRVALIPFALRAHAMWVDAPRWLGHDVGVVACEGLSLAFTEREEAILSERAAKRREAGAPIRLVTAAEASQVEPGLGPGVRMAAYCAVDGYANAYLTAVAFRGALVAAGVDLHENRGVTGADRDGSVWSLATERGPIRARRVVLCGGVWLERMAGWFGVRLPIKTLVNQLSVTERVAPVMRTVVGIASGLLSLKQYPHGTVVIGGGWQGKGDRDTGWTEVQAESLVGNARLACHAIPALKTARIARAWAGFEAETADALPAVGPLPGVPDVSMVGSVHSGYTSGIMIAKLWAERLLGREPELDMSAFDPGRLVVS
jgi:sarcosine oxidase, subunit beta